MEIKTLGELCNIVSGGTPLRSKPEYWNNGTIPWIKIGDMKGKYINSADECITQAGLDSSSAKMLPKGTILYTIFATLGEVGILEINASTNQAIAGLTIKDNSQILSEYLYYYLKSKKGYVKTIGRGVAQSNINRSILKSFQVPLPTSLKQKEIVDILDKITNIIKYRQQELHMLDNLIKARFVEMFGNGHDGFCNTKKLGEFCKFQQGTQIPVEEQIEEQLEGYTRFLRIIDYTQAPQIPRYVSVKGREIAEDSVVIVRYGATAGFVGHGYAGILANNLFEVVPDESILSKDFLYLALKYGTFEQEVHDKAFGAAMPALSFGMMNDIGVVTPNSTAQNGFVDFVKQVDKSKLLSGCRLFHSWAPENRDKPKHVGVPRRRTKDLRECRRQQ